MAQRIALELRPPWPRVASIYATAEPSARRFRLSTPAVTRVNSGQAPSSGGRVTRACAE